MSVQINKRTTYSCEGLTDASKEQVIQLVSDLLEAIEVPKEKYKLAMQDIMGGDMTPDQAYTYASRRFNLSHQIVQQTLKESPEHAYKYAKHILKSRWHTAEDAMQTNKSVWEQYEYDFIPKVSG